MGEKVRALGKHLIIELNGCDPATISYTDSVESVLLQAAKLAKANIVTYHFHSFKPYGVSGMIIISESHFSIHTWPEYGYAAVDIFTCSETVNEQAAIDYMSASFKAKNVRVSELERGILECDVPASPREVSLDEKVKEYRH